MLDKQGFMVLCQAVGEVVVETKGVPAGRVYAALAGQVTVQEFNAAVEALEQGGFLTQTAHYLEPTEEAAKMLKMG